MNAIPYDADAEANVIGACLNPADRVLRERALAQLSVKSFHDVKHQAVWSAIAALMGTGRPVDCTTVADELAAQQHLAHVGGKGYVISLHGLSSSISAFGHIEIVARHATRRQLIDLAFKLDRSARDLSIDPAVIVGALEAETDEVTLPVDDVAKPWELDEYLAIEDPPEDFVIPKMLALGDRLIITSGEGIGKSELQLQMAVCVACGIHPFFGYQIRRSRSLIVDLENSGRQLRPRLRRFRAIAADRYQGGLRIVERSEGLNLRDPRDFRWLDAQIEAANPDLVVIGPLYKMFRAKGSEQKHDETAAEEAAYAIDRLRVRHNIAVSIEAHSPKGDKGDRDDYRPIGASLWLRWPEFGLSMVPDRTHEPGTPIGVDLKHWRGARDRDRRWPRRLIQGGSQRWPWLAADEEQP